MNLFPKIRKLDSELLYYVMDNGKYTRVFWVINTDIQTKQTMKVMIRSWVSCDYVMYASQKKINDTVNCLIYAIGYWYFKKYMDKYSKLHKWWGDFLGQKMYIDSRVGTEVKEEEIKYANFNDLMWKNNLRLKC